MQFIGKIVLIYVFCLWLDTLELSRLDPSAVRPMLSTDPETSEATVLLFHSVGNDSGRHMCNAQAAEAEEVGCLRFEDSRVASVIAAIADAPKQSLFFTFISCPSICR